MKIETVFIMVKMESEENLRQVYLTKENQAVVMQMLPVFYNNGSLPAGKIIETVGVEK